MASISVAWPPRSGRADLCSFFVAVATLLVVAALPAAAMLPAGLWSLVLGTSLCIFKDPESKVGFEFIRSQSPVPSRCPAPSLRRHRQLRDQPPRRKGRQGLEPKRLLTGNTLGVLGVLAVHSPPSSSKLPDGMPAAQCCYQKLRMRPARRRASVKILPRRSLLQSRAAHRQLSHRVFLWWRRAVPTGAFRNDQPDRYASPTPRSRRPERSAGRRVQR